MATEGDVAFFAGLRNWQEVSLELPGPSWPPREQHLPDHMSQHWAESK